MLELYHEERGRECHENGIPLADVRVLCDEHGIEGEDRYLVIQAFRSLDRAWLELREKKRKAERAAAEQAAKNARNTRTNTRRR